MNDLEWWNPDSPALTPKDRKRLHKTQPKGHAWTPGTGPKGETCKTCRHLFRNEMAKVYLKCGLNRSRWTGGVGSDIRARDPACKFWERSE